jgi:hypothetical protein
MPKVNPNQPNPSGEIVTCLECGRDTKAKWAICNQCSSGQSGPGNFKNNSRIKERKDRKQNPYYHTR